MRSLAFVVSVAAQFVVLYWPRTVTPVDGVVGLDKIAHALLFFAVVWTGARVPLPLRALAVVSLVHAPISELLQQAVLPGRSGDPLDAMADAIGVLTAVSVIVITRSHRLSDPADGGRARRR